MLKGVQDGAPGLGDGFLGKWEHQESSMWPEQAAPILTPPSLASILPSQNALILTSWFLFTYSANRPGCWVKSGSCLGARDTVWWCFT